MISDKDTVSLITELNFLDETDEVEAKSISGDDVGSSVFETICAMCNEPQLGGGTILLGVAKEEALFPYYKATGVSDPDKITIDIASGCRTIFNRPVSPKIATCMVDGVPIVRIDVAEVDKASKPIFFRSKGIEKGAFRRIGSADVKCSDEDLDAIFTQKSQQSYDRSLVGEASWDDIDPEALAAYRRLRGTANPNAEELGWRDQELVEALGGATRQNGELVPTLAGLLSFGKSLALRRLMPSHRVDYIRISGKDWVGNSEGKFDTLDLRGPIVTLISRVISAILDDLPKSLIMNQSTSGARREVPSIPERVIREAVVNSLMHRSYQVHEPIQIVRYSNRIEIRNPGHSLKPEERLDSPGSIHRNPYVAAILHETLFAETKGSGIRVMQSMMEENGLAPPSFESDREGNTFTGRFLFHHFLGKSDAIWLSNFSSFELTPDQMKALIFVREVGAVDNSTFRSLNKVDTLEASQSLKKLHTLSLLVKKGQGSRTYYVKGPNFPSHDSMDGSGENMDGTIHVNAASRTSAVPSIDISSLPETLRKKVKGVHLAKRNDPDKVRELIVELCGWKPLATGEIAHLLALQTAYVSQKYLTPLVQEKRIAYTRPEMPRHPEQKYTKSR